jgi:hypothetical protein
MGRKDRGEASLINRRQASKLYQRAARSTAKLADQVNITTSAPLSQQEIEDRKKQKFESKLHAQRKRRKRRKEEEERLRQASISAIVTSRAEAEFAAYSLRQLQELNDQLVRDREQQAKSAAALMAEMEKNSQTRKKQRASRSPTIAVAIGVVAALAAAALNPAQMEVNAARMDQIEPTLTINCVGQGGEFLDLTTRTAMQQYLIIIAKCHEETTVSLTDDALSSTYYFSQSRINAIMSSISGISSTEAVIRFHAEETYSHLTSADGAVALATQRLVGTAYREFGCTKGIYPNFNFQTTIKLFNFF